MDEELKKLPKANLTIAGKLETGYYEADKYLFHVIDPTTGEITKSVKVQASQNEPKVEEPAEKEEKKSLFSGLLGKKDKAAEDKPKEKAEKPAKEKKENEAKEGGGGIKPAYIYTVLGIIAAALLVLAGAYAYKLGASSVPQSTAPSPTVQPAAQTGETVKVMRAKREIMPDEKLSSDNIEAFEVAVETQSKDQILLFSRLESYSEADYRAAKYIEEGSLIYPASISTSQLSISNPWTASKDLTYFDIVLTDAVIAEGKATWGKLMTITVYPKDAPDPEAAPPEGVTAEVPGDPETKYTLTVPICDITNENGENYFRELSLLSKIPVKDQRYYLATYLKEHEGFMDKIKPYSAKIALTAAQAAYLGDVSRRGAITNMVVTDGWDNGNDAKKGVYNAFSTLLDNMRFMVNKAAQ